jgi:hypothetical protein
MDKVSVTRPASSSLRARLEDLSQADRVKEMRCVS